MVRCLLGLLGLFALLGIIGIKSRESKESHSTSSYCPTSDPETTNTPADTKGTAMFDEQCPFSLLGFVAPLGLLSDDSTLTAATLPNRHKKRASVVMTEALIISILLSL